MSEAHEVAWRVVSQDEAAPVQLRQRAEEGVHGIATLAQGAATAELLHGLITQLKSDVAAAVVGVCGAHRSVVRVAQQFYHRLRARWERADPTVQVARAAAAAADVITQAASLMAVPGQSLQRAHLGDEGALAKCAGLAQACALGQLAPVEGLGGVEDLERNQAFGAHIPRPYDRTPAAAAQDARRLANFKVLTE